MTTYNIFYDSNKEIIWASNAPVNSDITTAEAAKGYTHVALDTTDIPVPEQFYINSETEQEKFDILCDLYHSLTIAQSMILRIFHKSILQKYLIDAL